MKKDNFIEKLPLVKFSTYSEIQKQYVLDFGENIIKLMKNFSPTQVDGNNFLKACRHIWFWELGAYEVVQQLTLKVVLMIKPRQK